MAAPSAMLRLSASRALPRIPHRALRLDCRCASSLNIPATQYPISSAAPAVAPQSATSALPDRSTRVFSSAPCASRSVGILSSKSKASRGASLSYRRYAAAAAAGADRGVGSAAAAAVAERASAGVKESASRPNLLDVLRERGLADAVTSEAFREAAEHPLKIYVGFDPTAGELSSCFNLVAAPREPPRYHRPGMGAAVRAHSSGAAGKGYSAGGVGEEGRRSIWVGGVADVPTLFPFTLTYPALARVTAPGQSPGYHRPGMGAALWCGHTAVAVLGVAFESTQKSPGVGTQRWRCWGWGELQHG
ncbi:unnamed protein product [Closterium sp. NIES-54]